MVTASVTDRRPIRCPVVVPDSPLYVFSSYCILSNNMLSDVDIDVVIDVIFLCCCLCVDKARSIFVGAMMALKFYKKERKINHIIKMCRQYNHLRCVWYHLNVASDNLYTLYRRAKFQSSF